MPRLSKIGAAALAAFGWTGISFVTATYLVVAGGGGGGGASTVGNAGAGGGAGGFRTGTSTLNPTLTYTVTVGAGGAGGAGGSASTGYNATSGSASVFNNISSAGGGFGACYNATSAAGGSPPSGRLGGSGGSGGGSLATNSGGAGNTPSTSPSQGNNAGSSIDDGGSGGGGAGAVGSNATASSGGNGGAGTASSISGSSVTYAGGGGGAGRPSSGGTNGTGGAGGGGTASSANPGNAGTANLGGGGAGNTDGANNTTAGYIGGQGGSGVVIISYPGAQQFGGGSVTSVGGNTIHTFNTSGTLSPLSSLTAQYLIVAGGGGGNGAVNDFTLAGGGGAGGLLSGTGVTIDTNSNYVVTVGAGGTGLTYLQAGSVGNGGNSSWSMVSTTAIGGGGGASFATLAGNGGSGGGAGADFPTGGTGTSGQGNNGGTATNFAGKGAGGGGGASAVGGNATTNTGGAGGAGTASSISGSSVTYAGGGGGAGASTGGAGGAGGGGAGVAYNNNGVAGTAFTGGGGGGAARNNAAGQQTGGNGGSGVVIIAYPGSTQQMAGGTVTISGGNVIHTFTSSGYLTPIKYASRSLRFRASASAYLNRTPASASNRKTFTWSGWVKRGTLTTQNFLFSAYTAASDSGAFNLYFSSGDALVCAGGTTNWRITTQLFRDPSAWYHIVVAMDTTQATAANRLLLYVNGVQVTAYTGTDPTLNLDTAIDSAILHTIAKNASAATYFDGYMTEVNFIDGRALTPSSFGTFNSFGVWQPITYGGSYGTNGFYLTFGNNTSPTTLGYDTSPQGNNWTANNFVATNATTIWSNYLLAGGSIAIGAASVFNGLGTGAASAPANGVTTVFTPPSSISYNSLEIKWGNSNNNNSSGCPLFINGIQVAAVNGGQGGGKTQVYTTSTPGTFTSISIGGGISGQYESHIDYIKVNGVYLTDYTTPNNDSMTDVPTLTSATVANYPTWNPLTAGGLVTFSEANLKALSISASAPFNIESTIKTSTTGKWYAEVTVAAGANNPAVGIGNNPSTSNSNTDQWAAYRTNATYITSGMGASSSGTPATFTTNDVIGVAYDVAAGTLVFYKNGTLQSGGFTGITVGSYSFIVRKDSASGDGGFLNCGQRPFTYTPPSGFVALNTFNLSTPTIPNGAVYMAATTYTGTGATQSIANTVNGTNFQPDFVWVKGRSGATDHALYDVVRGTTKQLESNTVTVETTESTGLTAFGSTGFTVGALAQMNTSAATYVAWQWAANGTGVTNTSGTITSTVSANTTAGFAVVTYTGTGANATVGHGLGVAPSMIIFKSRTQASVDWPVYHISTGNDGGCNLNETAAKTTSSTRFNNTTPTSTVFSVGSAAQTNGSTQSMLAYCFAAIAGYSAFGSYTGNGSTDGPFVYTGFRPRWVLVKHTNDVNSWFVWDSTRNSYNAANLTLKPNSSDAEETLYSIDALSNGFKIRTSDVRQNTSGGTYIYAAFAENPFKYANAR